MAALVKVNGLEAYALLDSGSTTISITHDFARMAKLNVIQLENPITLQLGTVGSQSIINFGSRSSLELGTIKDDDAYLDVVNIDRYDMIIGTPFMRKHGLVLDFSNNTLSHRGRPVPTLSAGQEDLMITRKRPARVHLPISGEAISRSNL
jgi:Aspartyl protease